MAPALAKFPVTAWMFHTVPISLEPPLPVCPSSLRRQPGFTDWLTKSSHSAASPLRFLPPLPCGSPHPGSSRPRFLPLREGHIPPPGQRGASSCTWVPRLLYLLGPHPLQSFAVKSFLTPSLCSVSHPLPPSLKETSGKNLPQVLLLG